MAGVRETMKQQQKQEVLSLFQEHGIMSFNDVAQLLKISYWTARNYVNMLVDENRIVPAKKEGTTVYFAPSGQDVIPSLPRPDGSRMQLGGVVKISLQSDTKLLHLNNFWHSLSQILAIIYAQPLLAAVDNTVSDHDVAFVKQEANRLIKDLEYRTQLLWTILDRVLQEDPDMLAGWARDSNYDPELALQAITKFYPDNQQLYSRALDWYKHGRPVDAD